MKLVFVASPLSMQHKRQSKDWVAGNQDKVLRWGEMSIRGLLFQSASTTKIQLSMLV